MKTRLDCYPCFLRQSLQAARLAGANEETQSAILDMVLRELVKIISVDTMPVEMGDRIHRLVREQTGNIDPYRAAKEHDTNAALEMYPHLKEIVTEAENAWEAGARLAIAGNIIDFGVGLEYDLWETVERVLVQPFAIDDGAAFRAAIDDTDWILYIADNAGETVFDRVFIETLDIPVVYAVKEIPVLNDATREDALAAGLGEVAEVISSGCEAPGTLLARCSDDFRARYAAAPLIIAKGQGNYEGLSNETGPLFFLLQTKCPVLSRDVGTEVGDIVLKRGKWEHS